MIERNALVLFQGDSITDCGRHREAADANNLSGLGLGYVNQIASQLLCARPGDGLRFLNRGISGHRVVDLYARWKQDAINMAPSVISILIGVNDTWHEFGSQNGVEVERYEVVYRMLLDLTRQRLPEVRLVLCEPFVLKCGVVTDAWLEDIGRRRSVVRKLAADYGACFVPFQRAFDEAVRLAPPVYWASDGVHPTAAGHRLMADCWVRSIGG